MAEPSQHYEHEEFYKLFVGINFGRGHHLSAIFLSLALAIFLIKPLGQKSHWLIRTNLIVLPRNAPPPCNNLTNIREGLDLSSCIHHQQYLLESLEEVLSKPNINLRTR